jgi:hypothetical protein
MNALELADKLEQKALTADAMEYGFEVDFEEAATMLRQQQAEIEALKKQIPDWENINKPNPFIGMSEDSNYKPLPPNSGLAGVALRKASEKC